MSNNPMQCGFKKKNVNPLFPPSLCETEQYGQGGEGGGNGQVSLGSRGWESGARGSGRGAAVSPGLGSWASRCAPHPAPFPRHRVGGRREGGGGGHQRGSAKGGAIRIVCPALQVPPPRDGSSSHKETPPQSLRNRCPSTPPQPRASPPLQLPTRALRALPTSCLLPLPFPKTKECRSPPHCQPRPAPSPLRTAPQDYQFFRPDNAIHLPGSSPASLVSTHLSNSLDGTALTLHFSFSFLPPPFLSPIFFLFFSFF